MNVSTNEIERSAAPFAPTGDLTDRMMGKFTANRSPAENLKIGSLSPSQGEDLKKHTGDLQKPSDDQSPVGKQASGDKGITANVDEVKSGNPSGDKTEPKKRRARKKWKKPKDKPNRPLSAYNLFFQAERASMLGDEAKFHEPEKGKKRVHRKTHGKIGFAEMARSIGHKWKELPEEKRKPFVEKAEKEKKRYAMELKAWKEEQKSKPRTKSIVAALKAESRAAEKDGSASVEASESHDNNNESLKLKIMAEEINQRNLALLQQRKENEYLRALQERQMALLASRSQLESNMFQQYPSAAEASAEAILQQFQNNMPGNGLGGMNPMGMTMGMGMGSMNMGSLNMHRNSRGSMGMMTQADLQQLSGRPSQLGAANGLQQLRGGLGSNMGDFSMGGSHNNANNMGTGQGNLGRLDQLSAQFGNNNMAAAMARRFQNRRNM